jgi:glycosyltransferase involved in cell wall biosynthesis
VVTLHIDTARTWRGGQQQTLLTVLGLRARGHRAILIAHSDGELFRRAAEGSDLIPLAPKGDVDLAAAWKLSRLIRQWKPAIVHAHDPHAVSMAGLALSFGAPSPRPKTIASRRVDFHLQGHSFSQWKYRQVDGFIAASGAIRDILVSDGIDRSRIVVVHDGIDVERIERLPAIDIHAEYWLPHGAPVVANVGALVGHKGQRYLVDATALVMREVPDVHVVIFGEGELRAPLEKQIRHLGLEKRVLLPGFREDVLSLVKSADLFVMSSVTEGLGSAVLDAMAMGLAVVGTRAGGIPEAVVSGTTGLIVEPGEPRPLADAIVRLLTGPDLRRRYGEAGRRRVDELFGVDRLIEGTLAAYAAFAGGADVRGGSLESPPLLSDQGFDID